MSNIAIKSTAGGSGTVTLEAPATNTDRVLVLPDSAGTMALQGGAGVGKVLQAAFVSQDTSITTSANMTYSNSLPLISQGAQILSQSFTPLKADSNLFFFFNTYGTASTVANIIYALFEDSACISAIAPRFTFTGESGWGTVIARHKAAGSTNTRTYSVRFGGQPGNNPVCTVNNYPRYLGVPQTTLMILEIAG